MSSNTIVSCLHLVIAYMLLLLLSITAFALGSPANTVMETVENIDNNYTLTSMNKTKDTYLMFPCHRLYCKEVIMEKG